MLYEVVIGNHGDDRNYSKLVLSEEPLTTDNIDVDVVGLDKEYEFILSVSVPTILINAWDINEFEVLDRLKQKILS
jgi:hypothetical protein